MDMDFVKECEEFYKQIGIEQDTWPTYDNPHEFATNFSLNKQEYALRQINTSDHVPVSEKTIESMINA